MAETSEAGFTVDELVAGFHFLKRLANSYYQPANDEVWRSWEVLTEAKRLVEVEGSGLLGYDAWRAVIDPEDATDG